MAILPSYDNDSKPQTTGCMYKNIVDQLQKHPTKSYLTRSVSQAEMIIIHHFGGDISVDEAARIHVEDNGWPGIGYHVVCTSKDVLLTNRLHTISYHCGGQNSKSVGLCVAWDWRHYLPPPHQLSYIAYAVDLIRFAVGRDIPVYPHSAFRPTDCPGDALYDYVRRKYDYPLPFTAYDEMRLNLLPDVHPDHIANDDDYEI